MFDQAKINISNLPNTTPRPQILEYLETAGPIKKYQFDEQGQKLSATITYYDVQSAESAKKYLDQKQFNTRKIKITLAGNRDPSTFKQPDRLMNKILTLKPNQKKKLFQYLKTIRNKEGQMFEDFLIANPTLVENLLKI